MREDTWTDDKPRDEQKDGKIERERGKDRRKDQQEEQNLREYVCQGEENLACVDRVRVQAPGGVG